MTRQVFHATLTFNHATSGKKMSKGNFILLSGAKFYEVNYRGAVGLATYRATRGSRMLRSILVIID